MSDSSSAQAAAAIIYANEVSPTMGEVSDVVDDDDTTVVDDDERRHEQRRRQGDTFVSSSERASV